MYFESNWLFCSVNSIYKLVLKIRENMKNNFFKICVDLFVMQQCTLFLIIGILFMKLFNADNLGGYFTLFKGGILFQITSNFLLAKEISIQVSSSNRLKKLRVTILSRIYILIALQLVLARIFAVDFLLTLTFIPMTVLSLLTVCIRSAQQVNDSIKGFDIFIIISVITLSLSLPIFIIAPLILIAFLWFLLFWGVSLAYYNLSGTNEQIEESNILSSGNIYIFILWFLGIATSEYDRYLLGLTKNVGYGADYAIFITAGMLPLVITIALGPRFIDFISKSLVKIFSLLLILIYMGVVLFVATYHLTDDMLLLLGGSFFKIICHIYTAGVFFKLCMKDAKVASFFSTAISVFTISSTSFIILKAFAAAAIMKFLSGFLTIYLFSQKGERLMCKFFGINLVATNE